MTTPTMRVGDRCIVKFHTYHTRPARIMAVAEGYAMLRYPRAMPFVAELKELELVEDARP